MMLIHPPHFHILSVHGFFPDLFCDYQFDWATRYEPMADRAYTGWWLYDPQGNVHCLFKPMPHGRFFINGDDLYSLQVWLLAIGKLLP